MVKYPHQENGGAENETVNINIHIEYSFRKKKTKREEFLEIMDEIIIIMQRYEREFIWERKIG